MQKFGVCGFAISQGEPQEGGDSPDLESNQGQPGLQLTITAGCHNQLDHLEVLRICLNAIYDRTIMSRKGVTMVWRLSSALTLWCKYTTRTAST